jgi:hypothetical protein
MVTWTKQKPGKPGGFWMLILAKNLVYGRLYRSSLTVKAVVQSLIPPSNPKRFRDGLGPSRLNAKLPDVMEKVA